jgi:hypothetical protein
MKRTDDVLMSFVFSSAAMSVSGFGWLPRGQRLARKSPDRARLATYWARPNSLIAAAPYSGGKVNATIEFWFR